jgi:hypothetical protein
MTARLRARWPDPQPWPSTVTNYEASRCKLLVSITGNPEIISRFLVADPCLSMYLFSNWKEAVTSAWQLHKRYLGGSLVDDVILKLCSLTFGRHIVCLSANDKLPFHLLVYILHVYQSINTLAHCVSPFTHEGVRLLTACSVCQSRVQGSPYRSPYSTRCLAEAWLHLHPFVCPRWDFPEWF